MIAASQKPEEKLVAGGSKGDIFATSSGSYGHENNLPRNDDHLRGGLRRLKNIDGYVYACGGNRAFARRNGVND